MSAHAPLAPSSAPQWGNCSGSIHASAGRADRPNERTVQGTAAHWVMEQCAKEWRDAQRGGSLFAAAWVGKTDPDGTVVTDEIAEGAQHILDDLLLMAGRYGGYKYLLIEQRVHMTRIHPDNWGTLDLALYNPDAKVLVLSDLKFGHRLVRARDNLQMIDYVAGLAEAFAMPLDTQVRIRIVQPFAFAPWGPVDEHVCTLADLVPTFEQLRAKAHEAYTDPKLTAGKHCRDCLGRVDCPAAREYLYLWGSICDMPYQMDRMSIDDKAREIDLLAGIISLANARKEALEDDVEAQMARGIPCSVKSYQSVKGRLNWDDGKKDAARTAFKALGMDIVNDQLYTPTQVIQRAPKELADVVEAMVTTFATRKNTIKLVDTEDNLVLRAFGANTKTGE